MHFDIGNLAQYSEALDDFAQRLGTQFTRFTSTKVQLLTQKMRRSACERGAALLGREFVPCANRGGAALHRGGAALLASGALPSSAVSSCPARIGLAGNPYVLLHQ